MCQKGQVCLPNLHAKVTKQGILSTKKTALRGYLKAVCVLVHRRGFEPQTS